METSIVRVTPDTKKLLWLYKIENNHKNLSDAIRAALESTETPCQSIN